MSRTGTTILILSVMSLLAGCKGGRELQRTPPPPWVLERPVSGMFYIGIGSAQKVGEPGAALQAAKERAAADLASEIAVRVESASLLESADLNGAVSEHFTSSIKSHAEERITGFEVVDVWEDEETIHVHYRLNKAKHAAERAARRDAAMEAASAECLQGEAALGEGMLLTALSHWGRGIMMLEEFWNEVNRTTLNGVEVTLEPHMVSAMRNAIQSIALESSVETVNLNADNRFRFPLGLHATHFGSDMGGVPIQYQYHNGTYRKSGTEFTDGEGLVVAIISGLEGQRPDPDLRATINLERLWKQSELDPAVATLVGTPTTATLTVPITVTLPVVHIGAAPSTTIGEALHQGPVQAMRSALITAGFNISESVAEADFTVMFNLRAEQRTPTGDYGNFHTAYVQGTVQVRRADGSLLTELELERVKGVQMNPSAALLQAMENAAESVEKNLGKKTAAALQ